jgi:hypothetical protein
MELQTVTRMVTMRGRGISEVLAGDLPVSLERATLALLLTQLLVE